MVPHTPWWKVARDDQLPPPDLETTKLIWLILAGRGWGKTRTGAEWAHHKAYEMPGSLGALIAKDPEEARNVMLEGPAGIMATAPAFARPTYNPSLKRITWPNNTTAHVFSAEEPEALRGPQHHWAWADEPFKWKNGDKAWDQVTLGLRLGERPQACLTSTPRPLKLLRQLLADPLVHLTRGKTEDNIRNLSPFYEALVERLKGTRLGRQELEAAILDDHPGALWTYSMFEQAGFRLAKAPQGVELVRVVIGVDPQATSMSAEDRKARQTEEEDRRATGIVVVGKGSDGRGYVLQDGTVSGRPEFWAAQAIRLLKVHKGDRIVAEQNQGGEMVDAVIRAQDRHVPVTLVHAARGKVTRAEPISLLYERGIVSHVGSFPEMEDEMCTYVPGEPSPNRMDALVWALTELFGRDLATLDDAHAFGERASMRQRPDVDLSVAVGAGGFDDMNLGNTGMGGMNL